MKAGPDLKALRIIEGRLLKTEAELAALPPDTKAWIEDYLRRRYGWFVRGKVATA